MLRGQNPKNIVSPKINFVEVKLTFFGAIMKYYIHLPAQLMQRSS